MSNNILSADLNGSGLRFALVASRFNDLIVERLVAGATDALVRHGVAADDVEMAWVPGAWELPVIAKHLVHTGRFDAVVALGAVIRGSTAHFEHVAGQCASGLASIALDTGIPVAFGVLTTDSIEQAIERAGTKAGNKGIEAATAALESVNLIRIIHADDPNGHRGPFPFGS
ncbi:MAG: 6,7-dimethyl-8-ribityllumazine synthase [Acidimicrobiia bacterium]